MIIDKFPKFSTNSIFLPFVDLLNNTSCGLTPIVTFEFLLNFGNFLIFKFSKEGFRSFPSNLASKKFTGDPKNPATNLLSGLA